MKEIKIDLAAHRIINPAPGQEWARSNVMAREDAASNVYPNKKELKPQSKIDPFMAELMAFGMWQSHLDELHSLIGWDSPEEG
jgi:phage terminase large subunit-like protein